MAEDKRKLASYGVDFVTALPVEECVQRLERARPDPAGRGLDTLLAPMEQQIDLGDVRTFTLERRYPGAMHPLRLVGELDRDADTGGTWVHGAVTHDAANQVLIEGMLLFFAFFLISALFFLRLRVEGFMFSLPLFLVLLIVFSIRWRALRRATEDMGRWVRRKLYVTPGQVR
ncbi:MAG TPA: hypothetical protein PKD09_08870 [Aggregatilinea sp.]|jgi:hypothetical protein|uniref:hypothetical protein n=1 Tax=Aggregatilinea sp. TaxID=2806333 RepID=UPI002BCA5892|nr:hypothetical protein [Aggregatilinea sp.]HML21746.1 hypothetical protein [Aggregatilinea sp.]